MVVPPDDFVFWLKKDYMVSEIVHRFIVTTRIGFVNRNCV
jgi:hypothetical protein